MGKDDSPGVGKLALFASAGNIASMLIGFGRNLALAAAIGTGLVGDSYNIANQVPNRIFLLLGGGAIAFVFVPQLMQHARSSERRSEEYGSFLIMAGGAFGVAVTVLLIALNPVLIKVMGGASWSPDQSALGLRLSLWCIPQVFFYALFAVASQLMYARGRFTAVAWLPATNSLVVILACIPIIWVGAVRANSPASVGLGEVILLGGSTLLGSAAQCLLLLLLLRRSGFAFRLRFGLRGMGLRSTGLAGLLTLAAAASLQLANLAVVAFSTQAGSTAKSLNFDGRGYTALMYAQALLFLAQAAASAGLANIVLQRLAQHYTDGDNTRASEELNEAVLAMGAFLVPVMALYICLGPLGAEVIFTRGETNTAAASFIGIVVAAMAFGLIPYTLHDLLIRPFFAVNEAQVPLRSSVIIAVVWTLGSYVASIVLAPQFVLIGIAVAFGIAYLVDLPLKLRSLDKRVGFRVSPRVISGYSVSIIAGLVAAAIVKLAVVYLDNLITHTWLTQTAVLLGGTAAFFAIYVPLTARSGMSLAWLVRWLRS